MTTFGILKIMLELLNNIWTDQDFQKLLFLIMGAVITQVAIFLRESFINHKKQKEIANLIISQIDSHLSSLLAIEEAVEQIVDSELDESVKPEGICKIVSSILLNNDELYKAVQNQIGIFPLKVIRGINNHFKLLRFYTNSINTEAININKKRSLEIILSSYYEARFSAICCLMLVTKELTHKKQDLQELEQLLKKEYNKISISKNQGFAESELAIKSTIKSIESMFEYNGLLLDFKRVIKTE